MYDTVRPFPSLSPDFTLDPDAIPSVLNAPGLNARHVGPELEEHAGAASTAARPSRIARLRTEEPSPQDHEAEDRSDRSGDHHRHAPEHPKRTAHAASGSRPRTTTIDTRSSRSPSRRTSEPSARSTTPTTSTPLSVVNTATGKSSSSTRRDYPATCGRTPNTREPGCSASGRIRPRAPLGLRATGSIRRPSRTPDRTSVAPCKCGQPDNNEDPPTPTRHPAP